MNYNLQYIFKKYDLVSATPPPLFADKGVIFLHKERYLDHLAYGREIQLCYVLCFFSMTFNQGISEGK